MAHKKRITRLPTLRPTPFYIYIPSPGKQRSILKDMFYLKTCQSPFFPSGRSSIWAFCVKPRYALVGEDLSSKILLIPDVSKRCLSFFLMPGLSISIATPTMFFVPHRKHTAESFLTRNYKISVRSKLTLIFCNSIPRWWRNFLLIKSASRLKI